ncbi:MAG TPA: TraR/DksA family transcriptional regulator [Phycisphaerales bacterium]|nr:TraR/DksA family transcriptional regulator [Phycisphaerales bacterium]
MKHTDLEVLRQQLLDLRAELRGVAESTREDARPVELDQASVGRLSRMDAMQIQAMAQATSRRREEQLLRIGAALRRMDEGDYGWCVDCGEEIDLRRLRIDPAATRCVACAERSQDR